MSSVRYSAAQKSKAVKLRLEGISYGKIIKKLGIKSKGTLSEWFKGLVLPPDSRKKLENNIRMAYERGLFEFNDSRSLKIQEENKQYEDAGEKLVGKINERELQIVGAALYWGEGTKSSIRKHAIPVSFSNSDPTMIQLFMRFIREILRVDEKRIRAGIHLYKSTNIAKARTFWASATGLPRDRFYIHTQVSRASQGKRAWNRLPHGTVTIRISNRKHFNLIMGMIKGLAENI